MQNLIKYFNSISAEFKKSHYSEKSVEKLFDLVYELEVKEKNLEEIYILSKTYQLLRFNRKALEILEPAIKFAEKKEKEKLEKLLINLKKESVSFYNKEPYRDLREAKIKKNFSLILSSKDFNIVKDKDVYRTEIPEHIENIVILNKYVKRRFIEIYSEYNFGELEIKKIISHIEWIADVKKDLMVFYMDARIDYKLSHINEEWFNNLEVIDLLIEIKDGIIYNQIAISDHIRQVGFYLETKDNTIVSLEYDPIL